MLERLRTFFSRPTEQMSEDGRTFIAELATQEVWLLVLALRGAPAIAGLDDSASLDLITEKGIDVSELTDDDAVLPFNYKGDGRQVLPFFRTEERAKAYLATLGGAEAAAVFQPCSFLAGFVADPIHEDLELICEPGSPQARPISRAERALLRELGKPRGSV